MAGDENGVAVAVALETVEQIGYNLGHGLGIDHKGVGPLRMTAARTKVNWRIDHTADLHSQPNQLLVCFECIQSNGVVIAMPFQRPKGYIDRRTLGFGGIDLDRMHPF